MPCTALVPAREHGDFEVRPYEAGTGSGAGSGGKDNRRPEDTKVTHYPTGRSSGWDGPET
jgi:hypothetical protein